MAWVFCCIYLQCHVGLGHYEEPFESTDSFDVWFKISALHHRSQDISRPFLPSNPLQHLACALAPIANICMPFSWTTRTIWCLSDTPFYASVLPVSGAKQLGFGVTMTLAKQVRVECDPDNNRCYIMERLISTKYRPVPHLSYGELSANRVTQAFATLMKACLFLNFLKWV